MTAYLQASAPDDGKEYDVQCGRCGSSMEFVDCDDCGGDQFSYHDCGEDTCMCADPEDNVPCGLCAGVGGFLRCLSGDDWCRSHPAQGREQVAASSPEWFEVAHG